MKQCFSERLTAHGYAVSVVGRGSDWPRVLVHRQALGWALCPFGGVRIWNYGLAGTAQAERDLKPGRSKEYVRRKREGHCTTATPKNNRQNESYRSGLLTSRKNLKIEVGELLFCLKFPVGRELSQIGWGLLERLLRRYVSAKGNCHD